jgi:hypothetical protein
MPETQWYPEGQEPFKQGIISWVKLYRVVNPVPSVLTANTVPLPELPPTLAVPYRVFPDNTRPPYGLTPSRLNAPEVKSKRCRILKPLPSMLTANTVPTFP